MKTTHPSLLNQPLDSLSLSLPFTLSFFFLSLTHTHTQTKKEIFVPGFFSNKSCSVINMCVSKAKPNSQTRMEVYLSQGFLDLLKTACCVNLLWVGGVSLKTFVGSIFFFRSLLLLITRPSNCRNLNLPRVFFHFPYLLTSRELIWLIVDWPNWPIDPVFSQPSKVFSFLCSPLALKPETWTQSVQYCSLCSHWDLSM